VKEKICESAITTTLLLADWKSGEKGDLRQIDQQTIMLYKVRKGTHNRGKRKKAATLLALTHWVGKFFVVKKQGERYVRDLELFAEQKYP